MRTPVITAMSLSPVVSLPSCSAAPPSMIFVTNIPLSPGMCWFPTPPAILKPRPTKKKYQFVIIGTCILYIKQNLFLWCSCGKW
jgi:hypothetical protein